MARRLLGILALGVGAALPATAHAGTYDVLTCSIDGRFLSNNAWVASNNPARDGRYVNDTRCLRPAPAGSMGASLAPNNGFSPGTYAGLWFFAPPGTTISNYTVVIKHFWFAPPLPATPPSERTRRSATAARRCRARDCGGPINSSSSPTRDTGSAIAAITSPGPRRPRS